MARIVRASALPAALLVLALAGSAIASVTSGRYSGTTNQLTGAQTPLEFSLSVGKVAHRPGKYVTKVFFFANHTGDGTVCATKFDGLAGGIKLGTLSFRGIAIKGNSFSAARIKTAPGEHLTISGKFSGTTVSGSFTDSFTSAQGASCTSGKVTFTASK